MEKVKVMDKQDESTLKQTSIQESVIHFSFLCEAFFSLGEKCESVESKSVRRSLNPLTSISVPKKRKRKGGWII